MRKGNHLRNPPIALDNCHYYFWKRFERKNIKGNGNCLVFLLPYGQN